MKRKRKKIVLAKRSKNMRPERPAWDYEAALYLIQPYLDKPAVPAEPEITDFTEAMQVIQRIKAM